jgi:hypothetical protein
LLHLFRRPVKRHLMARLEQDPTGKRENITGFIMFIPAGSTEKPAFLLKFYRLIKK